MPWAKGPSQHATSPCIVWCKSVMHPVLALVEAAAQQIERRPTFFFAGPVGPMVGLGLCSVAAAPSASMASWTRPDGRDVVGPT